MNIKIIVYGKERRTSYAFVDIKDEVSQKFISELEKLVNKYQNEK